MDRIAQLNAFLQDSPKDNFLRHALALEYIKAGEYSRARAVFEEILREDPGYIGSYYHLAKLLEQLNEVQLAIEWYQKGMAAAKAAKDQHAYGELQAALEEIADA